MSKDALEELGLSIEYVDCEELSLHETYPIFGCVTQIIENTDDKFVIQVNSSIILDFPTNQHVRETVIDRIFESGIFVVELTGYDEVTYTGICKTVIYGRKKELDA